MDKQPSKSKFWDNKIVWIIISILASVILWMYVTTILRDQTTRSFDGIPVEFIGEDALRDSRNLIITEKSHGTVSVRISGTRSDLAKLSSVNMKAIVDVSKVTSIGANNSSTFELSYPSTVESANYTRISSDPLLITYSVVRATSKTIDVKGVFNGTRADGFTLRPLEFNPDTVRISGPESEISRVANAWVVVDRQNVDKTVTFDQSYILVDSEGVEVPLGNIKLDTETVEVTLTVNATKEVPLTVDIVEGAGASLENIEITCIPETITIAGDGETLEGINKISLGTIDLTSFSALTFEQSFPIVLDNNITNVKGVTEAKVTIKIMGLETKKFKVTNFSLINVTQGYTGEIENETMEVTLRGSPDVLKEVQANNIRLVADCVEQGTSSGEFEIPAKVYVDGFTGVGGVGEYILFVKIT